VSPAKNEDDTANTTARFIRLRTITANSTGQGVHDLVSRPAIIPLHTTHDINCSSGKTDGKAKLQVEAVNRTSYAFRYALPGEDFVTIGWGNSSQVFEYILTMWVMMRAYDGVVT
jgi:hypothetical protein